MNRSALSIHFFQSSSKHVVAVGWRSVSPGVPQARGYRYRGRNSRAVQRQRTGRQNSAKQRHGESRDSLARHDLSAMASLIYLTQKSDRSIRDFIPNVSPIG